MEERETMGRRIAALRRQAGLTQEQVAERLGVTAQAVSKWENDVSCPDISLLPGLAELLGVSTDELLGVRPVEPRVVVVDTDKSRRAEDGEKQRDSAGWNRTWEHRPARRRVLGAADRAHRRGGAAGPLRALAACGQADALGHRVAGGAAGPRRGVDVPALLALFPRAGAARAVLSPVQPRRGDVCAHVGYPLAGGAGCSSGCRSCSISSSRGSWRGAGSAHRSPAMRAAGSANRWMNIPMRMGLSAFRARFPM